MLVDSAELPAELRLLDPLSLPLEMATRLFGERGDEFNSVSTELVVVGMRGLGTRRGGARVGSLPQIGGGVMAAWEPPELPDPGAGGLPRAMVEVTNVTKAFGDVVAVSDVTFTVGSGVTALLGPNGAGKSTLFRMMCGLTAPSQGTVRVLGADARADAAVRGRIGLAPQQDALFDRLSAIRFVEVAARTHAVPDARPGGGAGARSGRARPG